jgi:hypothetical protein
VRAIEVTVVGVVDCARPAVVAGRRHLHDRQADRRAAVDSSIAPTGAAETVFILDGILLRPREDRGAMKADDRAVVSRA